MIYIYIYQPHFPVLQLNHKEVSKQSIEVTNSNEVIQVASTHKYA